MVTSISATSSSTVVAEIQSTKLGVYPSKRCHFYHCFPSKLYFPVSPKPKIRLFSSKPLPNRMVVLKAQSNNVSMEVSNSAPATSEGKSGLSMQETNDVPLKESSAAGLVLEESISEFINQVSDLVKLVDSRDIEELKLKQLDCEILIKKRLAVPSTQTHGPFTMQSPEAMASPTSSAPARPPPSPVPALPAPVAESAKLSVPPVLSPMAGTFYRSPAPGEPPFVKVGDKVKKGQVLCIIEAMKLMNEIQAEQAGTLVEIIAEDGKPISKDSPLFAIQP